MKHATLIDATDLDARADYLEGRVELPALLRRLVVTTTPSLKAVAFRTGEGIQYPGWDGRVETEEGTAWVPPGVSAWEAGVSLDRKRKADDDYRRRSEKPLDVDPKETTFVFVTLRRWTEKGAWASAKRLDGLWRDVRAYDADDLEGWLETAPGVHVAFSRLFGKRGPGTSDLEGWWEDWRAETAPPLSPMLLLAGREKAISPLQDWLGLEATQPFALQAESLEEAVAVLAACIMQMPPDARDRCLGRALVIRDRESWDRYSEMDGPLLLVPWFAADAQGVVGRATRNGKAVYVPLDRATSAAASAVQIPRISWAPAKDALVGMGKSESAARPLASLARRSLLGLRRKLGVRPELQQPAWAAPVVARRFLPLVFAGSWSETSSADQTALATLAGIPYADIRNVAMTWANAEDPPIRRIGDVWVIASKEDAWPFVEKFALDEDLRRFAALAVEVLGAADPRYDLPSDKRFMAPVLGKVAPTSPELRDSLADSVAMLGSRGNVGSGYAAEVVRRLLEQANADWKVWASLSPFLPRLAEGAPEAFLAGVETGLKSPPSLLLRLFDDGGDALFGTSPHTGLLWALEVLAWSAEYLPRAALALATLSRLDPGGRTLNRPLGSLHTIFLAWFPQTSASVEQRFKVLDRVRSKEPEVAWRLLLDLLPARTMGTAFPNAEPHWREWTPEQDRQVNAADYQQTVRGTAERVLQDVAADGARWSDVISNLDAIPPECFDAVVARLSVMDPVSLAESAREKLWEALREFVATHRQFSDATWALPSEQVDRVEPLIGRFQPADPATCHAWLFDHMPRLLLGKDEDWSTQQAFLYERRLRAVREVHEGRRLDGVIALASRAAVPGLVGDAVGAEGLLASEEEESLLLLGLGAADSSLANLARGYIVGRHRASETWADVSLAALTEKLTATQRANFLLCLPDEATTWDRVDACDDETRRQYWSFARPLGVTTVEECVRVVRALIGAGRTVAAIDLVGMLSHGRGKITVPSGLILEALGALCAAPGSVPFPPMVGYNVRNLLDQLGKSGEVAECELATFEWTLLPLLEQQGGPIFLNRELGRSPDLFGLLLGFAFVAEGEGRREFNAEDRARAERAYRVLSQWRRIPGLRPDGTLDPDELATWVRGARALAALNGRRTIGDLHVGQILAAAPIGADGIFPHPGVREILESAESTEIEAGFRTAVINSRGVYTKDPSAGGEQEREFAQRYRGFADALALDCPRTAAVLRSIAAHYVTWAAREDAEAEMRHDRYA